MSYRQKGSTLPRRYVSQGHGVGEEEGKVTISGVDTFLKLLRESYSTKQTMKENKVNEFAFVWLKFYTNLLHILTNVNISLTVPLSRQSFDKPAVKLHYISQSTNVLPLM